LENKLKNRESRQEDIELIGLLRRELADTKSALTSLNNEKKYFQMELVNRENNFNKIFNASPNIGIINPLNSNTKVNFC
jgi:hypothetical protein